MLSFAPLAPMHRNPSTPQPLFKQVPAERLSRFDRRGITVVKTRHLASVSLITSLLVPHTVYSCFQHSFVTELPDLLLNFSALEIRNHARCGPRCGPPSWFVGTDFIALAILH